MELEIWRVNLAENKSETMEGQALRRAISVEIYPAPMLPFQVVGRSLATLVEGHLIVPQTLGEKLKQGGVQLALGWKLRWVGGKKTQDLPVIGHNASPVLFPQTQESDAAGPLCQNCGLTIAGAAGVLGG